MDAVPTLPETFGDEIRALIRDTEACLARAGNDREAELQRAAFRERCERALAVVGRLARATPAEADLLDGDVWLARESLTRSREFFLARSQAA